MKNAVFDIDGVLCSNDKYKNWFDDQNIFVPEKFEADIPTFKPIYWGVELLNAMSNQNYYITLLTGRRGEFREKTENWLSNNNIFYDSLIMNDKKEDVTIFKKRIIKSLDDVLFIVEDHPDTVKMFRDEGYICLQPNHLYGG